MESEEILNADHRRNCLKLIRTRSHRIMVLQFFSSYRNLILHASLSLSLSVLLSFLQVPTLILHGLFTYIHPDTPNNGVRAAIRKPENSSSDSGPSEVRKRTKTKDKFEFDESKAQIFRLKLDESHLRTRIYFKEYNNAFIFTFLGVSCLLLQSFLGASENSGVWAKGIFVPLLFGVSAVCKLFVSLGKVAFEKSASRRLDKQLSLLFGIAGFLFGLLTCSILSPLVLDFEFGEIGVFGTVFVATLMGCFAGFLFMPAAKSSKSFWLGTDQIRSNLEMIHCGWFSRMILYSSHVLMAFTTLLWINPLAEILINKNMDEAIRVGNADRLVGNMGFSREDFCKFRVWCLSMAGLLQIVAVRPNLQMYLNEALVCWYQRLHAGKVPDLDFSRAKIFLHNHYLCVATLQFFAPPALVLLFIGLSQLDVNCLGNSLVLFLLPYSTFVKQVPLLMAWWLVCIMTLYSSAIILLYRRGTLYLS